MPRIGAATLGLLALLAAGCAGSPDEPPPAAQRPAAATAPAACEPARVRYRPYPGGDARLSGIPWVSGEPASTGLVGLLWYWPEEWRAKRLREARIYTGGVAPQGWNDKILWAFVAASARGRGGSELVVVGRRADGQAEFSDRFAAISYSGQEGAPSYASIIDVPTAGCWRLELATGRLRAHVDLLAVKG
jgi:hypothetical protein